MKLDAIDEGLLIDRPRVRRAPAQGFAIGFARSPDVRFGDRRKWDELYGVDLDQAVADPVAAALLDLRPRPQPDRHGDIARQNVIAQLAAELHTRDARSGTQLGYMLDARYILIGMSKHLIDLDEDALSAARTELGTTTIKDTVNEALRRTVEQRRPRVVAALDALAAADLDDRADAWR